jgi:hypothetical protein
VAERPKTRCNEQRGHRSLTTTNRRIAVAQAAYYLPTAIAPFLSRRRFEATTGPKLEWWLVITVSTLIGAIGSVLGLAGLRRERPVPGELQLLGAASAAGLAAVDVVYVARRRISPVYLIDGVLQLAFAAAWALSAGRRTPRPRRSPPPQ